MIIPHNHKFNHPASKTYRNRMLPSMPGFIKAVTNPKDRRQISLKCTHPPLHGLLWRHSKKIQIWFLISSCLLNRGVDKVCAFGSFHLHDSWLGLAWEKGAAIGSHPGTMWGHMKMAGWGGHVSNDLVCQGESSFCEFRVCWFAYIFWWNVKLESFQQNSLRRWRCFSRHTSLVILLLSRWTHQETLGKAPDIFERCFVFMIGLCPTTGEIQYINP